MADVPVEVKKAAPAETTPPDVWRSFRSEMDRLFDRFGFPSLRRMFDMEPAWRSASSFTFSVQAIDMSEDEKAYKMSAELLGLDATDVDVSVSGNTLVLKGEKHQEKDKNYYFSERADGSFQRAFELPSSVDSTRPVRNLLGSSSRGDWQIATVDRTSSLWHWQSGRGRRKAGIGA